MAVTLREVAERAGVSRSAVSRTFTEGASVSAATRARVMEAAEALEYSPNAPASSLTTVHQPIERIVRCSIERVVTLLQQPGLPAETLLMDCHVVERGTLRPLPGLPSRKPA